MLRCFALMRAGALALALIPAGSAWATGDGYAVRNAAGQPLNLRGHTLGTGDVLPYSGLTDMAGNPIMATNPLRVGPGVVPIVPVDRSGAVTTAGAVAVDIIANTNRKGGWIRAASTNTGNILVTLKNADGSTHVETLEAGATLPLTINGYVVQVEIEVAGDTVGDTFSGVEFQ